MANQVTNYKCPACTGPLRFDSATGKLQCDFCGSSYEVAEIEKLYAEKDAQAAGAFRQAEEQAAADGEWTSASGSDWGADAEKLRVYSCPSCGAELICDETTSATSCPYCGNNTIVPGQFSGALKPDYVLPFKLDKAAAVAALKKHYGGKKLLPKAFSNENHIEEVKGVYVPFWLYDGSAEVDVRCHGTKVSGYSTARENVTVTNHYDVRRAGTVRFERVPVDASSKMPDDHMDAIEPFDYKELKPFSTAYLPGFLADKYDVSVQDCAERADSRCETSAVELMEQDARGDYTSCTVESRNVTLHRGKVHYALMPVWLLSTKWNGKSFLFAMNGQTGKLVGDLPLDKGLYWKHFAAITGLCMLGVMAAGLLLSLMMKKYASLLFALVLALSLSVSAAADSSGVYVYDDAALLTQEEYDTLNEAAAAVSEQYGCGVYVVTVDDMADYIDPDAVTETGETGMAAFTEYAWDALGLAASHDSNGIMLALSMAERDFQMLAHGDTANAAFTDYGKYIMQDEFLDNFREDDWYGGFADYIAACGRYLEANANGAPIDVEPSDETEEEYEPLSFGDKLFFAALMAFRFGLPLGLIVAFIVCAVYKRQLKSVRRATEAARYTVSGGAEITAREDRFTHTTEVRTPIKTESDDHDSGPSFSGGTTVNSGGFSHSGGKF